MISRWAGLAAGLERHLSGRRAALLALSALFLLVAAYHAAYTVQLRGFNIMTDELQYLKLALNVPETPVPELRGKYFASFNQLYPILLAPLGAIVESMPALFISIHVANPVLMASVVFPAYLLARQLDLSRFASLVAAAIAVAGPWLVYTNLVMTENVAYPAFVWALLAMQRALAAPSPKRDLVALAGIALAASARTQFAALFPVFLLAIFLERANRETVVAPVEEEEDAFRRGLRIAAAEHRPLLLVSLAIGVVAIILTAAVSPDSVVGIYGTVFEKTLLPNGLATHMVEHAATLTVGFGVVPVVLAAAFTASALRRPVSAEWHSFAWLLLLSTLTVLFISSSFNVNFSDAGLNDRYLFYVLPPLGVAAVFTLVDRRVSWQSVAVAGVAIALLMPYAHLEGYSGAFWVGAPSSAADPVLNGKLSQLNDLLGTSISIELAALVAVLAVTAATVLLVRSWRGPAALVTVGLAVLGWQAAETQYQYDSQGLWERPTPRVISNSLRSETIGDHDWIDKVVGSGSVALAPSVTVDQVPWWQDEFFNRRVDRVMRVENPSHPRRYRTSLVHLQLETLFPDELRIDPRTGSIKGPPRERVTPYIVTATTEARLGFAGARTLAEHPLAAKDVRSNRRLQQVDLPYRAAWWVDSILDDGWTVGPRTTLLLFPRSRRPQQWNVAIRLRSSIDVKRAREWTLEGPGVRRAGRLRPASNAVVRDSVCVRPGPNPTRLRLRVRGRTRLPDGRSVGLLVRAVRATPAAACGGASR